jgi:hypothetical protein
MAKQTTTPKRKRGRSPSYPGIDLKEALDRTQQLHTAEGRHPAPVETVLVHWGYKSNSGPGLVTLAALKKFGLITDEGSGKGRKVQLTEDAIRILLDKRPGSSERREILQRAALKPAIHRELWDKYGNSLPSDANLRFELTAERGFTTAGADEFIPQYKQTLAFAELLNGGKLSSGDEDSYQPKGEGLTGTGTATPEKPLDSPPSDRPKAKIIQLPIAPQEWAALQAEFPLTEEKWTQMFAVLNAMKPALVQRRADERSPNSGTERSD